MQAGGVRRLDVGGHLQAVERFNPRGSQVQCCMQLGRDGVGGSVDLVGPDTDRVRFQRVVIELGGELAQRGVTACPHGGDDRGDGGIDPGGGVACLVQQGRERGLEPRLGRG